MWWIIAGSVTGYLVTARGTFGFLTWQKLMTETADRRHTAEENTLATRQAVSWLWPVLLIGVTVDGLRRGLSAFVTGRWN